MSTTWCQPIYVGLAVPAYKKQLDYTAYLLYVGLGMSAYTGHTYVGQPESGPPLDITLCHGLTLPGVIPPTPLLRRARAVKWPCCRVASFTSVLDGRGLLVTRLLARFPQTASTVVA